MKIVYICGNMAHYDHGLGKLTQFTQNIFTDLGVETEIVDLGAIHPPHYEGETHPSVDNLVQAIKSADGLVLACTAQLFAPTALMQSFLEYMQQAEYCQTLEGKHCLLVALSLSGGEKSALDYMTRVILHFGGIARSQIGLQAAHLADIEEAGANPDSIVRDFVEKETEDFYRAVNQNRPYVAPADYIPGGSPGAFPAVPVKITPGMQAANSLPSINPVYNQGEPTAASIQNRLEAFTEQQEQDIEELSRLFSKKYNDAEDMPAPQAVNIPPVPASMSQELPIASEAALPHRAKTIQQLTQSLPHCYQPQLSAGLQTVVQINISGAESFQGFLYIHSTECSYSEGTAPAPDMTIMADSSVWLDILKNKQTAQKAFMIGALKVRGDFILLSKFDSLFKME